MGSRLMGDLDSLSGSWEVRAYKLRTVAAALGVTYETVRGWADAPVPPFRIVQSRKHATRRVPLYELRRLAREGWPVDVGPLLDED